VREVEQYQLDIVGLTSTHNAGSGTKLLEKGWTLFFSGVAHGESGDTHKPLAERCCVGVCSGEREGHLPTPTGCGENGCDWFVLMHQTAVPSIQNTSTL